MQRRPPISTRTDTLFPYTTLFRSAGIHMSDIPAFPYADLWGERTIASVANLTRDDGTSFFKVVQKARVKSVTTAFRSEEHTSELQSLMRISYAVFCLKKKNKQQHTPYVLVVTHNSII